MKPDPHARFMVLAAGRSAVAWSAALLLLGCAQPPPDLSATLPAPDTTARSGYAYQSADTQALQDDPFANPGMLWVDMGARLWAEGNGYPACVSCHGDASISMRGVAARLPAWHADAGALLNLEGHINRCRIEHQQQPPWPHENEALLSMSAFIAHQSAGLPMMVSIDGAAQPHFEAGRDYFHNRRGQMNLACHHCHEYNAGRMLRGDRLSEGHANGYPAYRLEWQTLGSLQRRLRFCNVGVRAEPFPFGAPEYVDLELYLAWRSRGLPIEAPAVRR